MDNCSLKEDKVITYNDKLLDNLDDINKLQNKDYFVIFPQKIINIILKSNCYFLIKKNNKLIGLITTFGLTGNNNNEFEKLILQFTNEYKVNKIAFIYRIIVDENERRKGYGKYLLLQTIKKLSEHNVQYLCTHVRIDDKICISMFDKMGFTKYKTIKNFYKDKIDSYIMFKQLY